MMTTLPHLNLDIVTYRYYRLEFVNTIAIKIGILSIGLRTEFELGFIGYKNYFTATTSTLTGSNVSGGYSVNSLKNWQAWGGIKG